MGNLKPVQLSSQPARAVWIEILKDFDYRYLFVSQPARAVWIEMANAIQGRLVDGVTACEGCVD